MIIARSFRRKALVTVLAVGAFGLIYQANILDSTIISIRSALQDQTQPPAPGTRTMFSVSAYCKGETTASGAPVESGHLAADPRLLPVGSVVQIDSVSPRYNGLYTVMDTGPNIQGRQIDIYIWSCTEALQFGRKPGRVTVLRLGWDPKATPPGLLNRVEGLFKKIEPHTTPRPTTP